MRKMGIQRGTISIYLDFKRAYDSVRRQVLYNFLKIHISMKLVRLQKCRTLHFKNRTCPQNVMFR